MADVVKICINGLSGIVDRVRGAGVSPSYLGWGTGTNAATENDTVLQTPRAESRTNGTLSSQTTTLTGDTLRNVGTITCAGTSAAITELGMFDASISGNLYLRATFDPINLNVADSITFTVNVKIANA